MRGKIWGEIEEVGGKYIKNSFEQPPEEASTAHGSSISAPGPKPGPSIDADGSSSSAPSLNPGASSSTAALKPGPSTESDHSLTAMNAPVTVLSTIRPAWFHPDNKFLGAHAPQPNTRPSTEFDSDLRLVVEEPPSPTKGSTESSLVQP